jgi:4-aminobutyrate aminotransferase-like enzyme
MAKERLIEKVDLAGASLRKQIEQTISKKAGSGVTGVKGLGTSLYIETQDGETAFKLQQHLLKEGVVVKANGSRGISVKPALIMEQKHVDQFTAALSKF